MLLRSRSVSLRRVVALLFIVLAVPRLDAQSACSLAWESVAKKVVNLGYATWTTNISQAGCNDYKLQMLPPVQARCTYDEAKKDADDYYAGKQNAMDRCLASGAMPSCATQANDVAVAAEFKSHVGQMGIWNGCTAQGGVTISGAITNRDGLPVPGVKVTFGNGANGTTDTAGHYAVTLYSGYTGPGTPSLQGFAFDPSSRSYTSVTSDQGMQNYVASAPYLAQQVYPDDGGARDQFGAAVAMDGKVLVVGAPGWNKGQGAAYIFEQSGSSWAQTAKLTLTGMPWFGHAVAISGDTLAVGSCNYDTANLYCKGGGAVYVYTRVGATWAQQAKLTSPDTTTYDTYGASISLDGNTLVAGSGKTNTVYVYTRNGSTWSQQARIAAPAGPEGYGFGSPVAVDKDTLAIGATSATIDFKWQGAAYVYVRSGNVWTRQGQLTVLDAKAEDRIGGALAVQGDTIVLGASGKYAGAEYQHGAAYIFKRSGGIWKQQGNLAGSGVKGGTGYGGDVALDGNRAIVGARLASAPDPTSTAGSPISYAGVVHVFNQVGSSWTEQVKLTSSAPTTSDNLGSSVAVRGGIVAAGVPTSVGRRGSVVVFTPAVAATRYSLTLQASPPAGGTVTASPATGPYDAGASVQVTAAANAGYQFSGWGGDLTGTANPQNVVMNKDLSVTASFTPLQTAQPDLVITDVGAPSSAVAGGRIAVSAMARNQGEAASGSFRVTFSLSEAAGQLIALPGAQCDVAGLEPGTAKSCEVEVAIPERQKPGPYYLAATADAQRAIDESNESNNVALSSGTLAVSAAPAATLQRVGSFPYLVSGGGWKASIALTNAGSAAVRIGLVFRGNDGAAWNLPVVVRRPDNAESPSTVSALERTLNPYATLLVEAQAGEETEVSGWVEVLANGPVGGFASLRNAANSTELVAPMESRSASSVLVTFDNADGRSLVIVSNLDAGASNSVTAIVRDEDGSQLSEQTIEVPAGGRGAYLLAADLPATLGKRGTLEFRNASGLAAVTLQLNRSGGTTIIPAL